MRRCATIVIVRRAGAILACVFLVACGRPASDPGGATSTVAAAAAIQQAHAKAPPPTITDFPEAPQTLTFSGTLTGSVSVARPTACGAGSGMNSPVLFAYGAYFQIADAWYLFYASTNNPPYAGPGTYQAKAEVHTMRSGGVKDSPYLGAVQLAVTSDRTPDTGTVSGTLTRTDGSQVLVSGGWTCTWSDQLGPG